MTIWEKFNEKNNLIKEYKHWKLLVRKKQRGIGSCVIILKRDAFPISKVTEEEMAEYALVSRDIERALAKTFKPHLVHHMALMFFDKHIHFHLFPRYKESIDFAGKEWRDEGSPNPLLQKATEESQDVLNHIKDELKRNI